MILWKDSVTCLQYILNHKGIYVFLFHWVKNVFKKSKNQMWQFNIFWAFYATHYISLSWVSTMSKNYKELQKNGESTFVSISAKWAGFSWRRWNSRTLRAWMVSCVTLFPGALKTCIELLASIIKPGLYHLLLYVRFMELSNAFSFVIQTSSQISNTIIVRPTSLFTLRMIWGLFPALASLTASVSNFLVCSSNYFSSGEPDLVPLDRAAALYISWNEESWSTMLHRR